MIASLFCFVGGFFVQGLIAAIVMQHFDGLSVKRRSRTMTSWEKWQQAIISLPAKPLLEAVLSKDRKGSRVIVTIALLGSGLLSIIFTSSDGFMVGLIGVLLAITWLSL